MSPRYKTDLRQSRILARNSFSATADEQVTEFPFLASQMTLIAGAGAASLVLRNGDATGTIIGALECPAGELRTTGLVEAPNGLYVEVSGGTLYMTGAKFEGLVAPVAPAPGPPPLPPPHTEGLLIDMDPSHASNIQVADNTQLSIGNEPLDVSGNSHSPVFDGVYSPNLRWRDGTDLNAPNGQPYWERLEADGVIMALRHSTSPFSGLGVAEMWWVLRSENDPAGLATMSRGPVKYGTDAALAFWPIEDLGGSTRDVYMHFGTTIRERILHATLVTKGLTVPFFDSFHIVRCRVSGATGAGNATIDIWINGQLIQTTAGKTIGHETTPRFYVGGAGDAWAGKLARLQVFDDNLTVPEAAAHLAHLQAKYGIP